MTDVGLNKKNVIIFFQFVAPHEHEIKIEVGTKVQDEEVNCARSWVRHYVNTILKLVSPKLRYMGQKDKDGYYAK